MRRIAALSVVLLVLAYPLCAQKAESGVDMSTAATYMAFSGQLPGQASVPSLSDLSASLTATTFFNAQSDKGGFFRFRFGLAASPAYEFLTKVGGQRGAKSWDLLNLQELVAGYRGPVAEQDFSSFSLSLGRFSWADPTGLIYAGTLDGVTLGFDYRFLGLDLLLGYTGLLWRTSSTVSMNLADALSATLLGSPRLVMAAGLRVPVAGQSIYAHFLAQEDLRPESAFVAEGETALSPALGGPVDTQYATLGASGLIAGAVSYSGFAALQSGRVISYMDDESSPTGSRYKASSILAFAMGLNAGFTILPGLTGGAGFEFSSGDADASGYLQGNSAGTYTQFSSITSRSVALVFSPQPGNATHILFSVGWTPFQGVRVGMRSLQTSSNSYIFMKSGIGPASAPGVLAAKTDTQTPTGFLGFEEDLTATVRLLPDFVINAALGVFFPATAPFGAFDSGYASNGPQLLLRLGCSLSI